MQAWKLLLCRLSVSLLSIIVLSMGNAQAGQQVKNNDVKIQPKSKLQQKPKTKPKPQPQLKPKPQASPIIGEMDDTDTMPIEDEEASPDEQDVASPKSKNTKGISATDQENATNKKRDKKKEQILEGFKQAQQFHMTWHNLPTTRITTSHENLIKFCKVACIKKHCLDREVADKCHLMCPEETTRQCPDPLKEACQDVDGEEVTIGNDEASGDVLFPDSVKVVSPIEQAEKNIADGDGEGG